jgi:type I restriction enzyme R subunit
MGPFYLASGFPWGGRFLHSLSGIDNVRVLAVPPFNAMGTPLQLIKPFGTKAGFEAAVHELQDALYEETA